jgi:hypothetical protein
LQLLPSSASSLPRRAVALAVFLLATGTSLFIAGIALAAQGTPHATPLLVLGAVTFLPVRTTRNIKHPTQSLLWEAHRSCTRRLLAQPAAVSARALRVATVSAAVMRCCGVPCVHTHF